MESARVVMSTVSGLGKRELQHARMQVDAVLIDQALLMQQFDLVPLMEPITTEGPSSIAALRHGTVKPPRLVALYGRGEKEKLSPVVTSRTNWLRYFGYSIFNELKVKFPPVGLSRSSGRSSLGYPFVTERACVCVFE